ncbi:hypothetical protein SAY86_031108 [Trapa natans]|uniref:Transglutaminase-like domain-containing protein n=1 Tax=Trapa natans TaxID=22666 RepID=A0AAN7RD86_TRANT|nr:hypothetical protein SAY86_031108 [Trapa natans]
MEQYFAGQNAKQFEEKLRPFISQIRLEGNLEPTKAEQDHAFLIQLVYWFRRSFKWDSDPRCEGCGSETINQGLDTPIPSELQYGAFRVELYSCRYCLRTTRCPRYNDPLKLLETRSGRCGEWANCFTLYCRAFGYATRLVGPFLLCGIHTRD